MTFSQHKSSQPFGGEERQPSGASVAQSPLKRRGPASLSVRLRPNPSKRLKTSLTNREGTGLKAMQARILFPESSSTARIKSSKLPSPVKRSKSAEQWYHDTNENLNNYRDADAFPDGKSPPPPSTSEKLKLNFFIDDPPFYLHRSPSDLDSACAVPSNQSLEIYNQRTHRVTPHWESVGRTIEELRSVIDDLTIRNNKMRKKLKRYEKLHCSHLRKEILFEVRTYGLQSRWKRGLEQTLRSFASSMEGASNRPTTMAAPPGTSLGQNPGEFSDKPSWSSDSFPKNVDSAYASISASGQTQNSQTAHNYGKSKGRIVDSIETHRLHFNSHPHDAQHAFSLKRLRFISAEAKQKLIVQRLEQLFTDKSTSTTADQESLQQHVVSCSAASGDMKASEAGDGSVEMKGVREARILTTGAGLPVEGPVDVQAGTTGQVENDSDDPMGGDTVADSPVKSEQRPTWPLDLDISRAQASEEAMKYVRHLGPYCSGSWIHLNLLSNMAQLHFFNVTPDFVRRAVARFSSKFDISPNGQKLRWKGGTQSTRLRSDSGSNAEPRWKYLREVGGGPAGERKRTGESSPSDDGTWAQSDVNCLSQVSNYNSPAGPGAAPRRRPDFLHQFNRAANFQYKPLLFHAAKSERDDSYDYDNDSLTSSDGIDSMAGIELPHLTARSISKRRGSNGGPIIFYNSASFCIDLSGDRSLSCDGDIMYNPCTNDPVGSHMPEPAEAFGAKASKRPLIQKPLLDDSPMNDSENDDVSMAEFDLTMEQSEPKTDDIYDGLAPAYMEASGLGGVQPQDNFFINVRVKHVSIRTRSSKILPSRRNPCHVQRVLQSLRASVSLSSRESSDAAFRAAEILFVKTTLLPPSTLPEPSYCLTLFSEDGEDSDDDHSSNRSSDEEGRNRGPTVSSVEEEEIGVDFLVAQSESENSESSQESSLPTSSENGSDEDEDSSIDLLAHARALDPATVAARELEFETNHGQMLAKVPVGSSAATVGGGSEFSSEYSSSLHTVEEEGRFKAKKRRTTFAAAVLSTKN